MQLWAGFLAGIFAGLLYIALRHVALHYHIDDPLDACAVHFGGGLWGLFAASIFADNGLIVQGFTHASVTMLAYRIVGALAIFAWSAVGSLILFGLLKYFGILRVSLEDEITGLDISIHNEPAYPKEANTSQGKQGLDVVTTESSQHFRNMAFTDTEVTSNQR